MFFHPFLRKSFASFVMSHHAQRYNPNTNATNVTVVCSIKVSPPRRKVVSVNMTVQHGHVLMIAGNSNTMDICVNKTTPTFLKVPGVRGGFILSVFGPVTHMDMDANVLLERRR